MSVWSTMSSSLDSPVWLRDLFSASCRAPPLPCPGAATASPDRILLEPLAYVADRINATTAQASSSTGYTVQATFCVADSPGVSSVCIHCLGLTVADFPERPRVICSDKDLLLLWVTFKFGPHYELGLREYFVYKAGPGRPSLHLLPDPHPLVLRAWEVALVPHGDDGHFVIAALSLTQVPWIYDLHLFSSTTGAWSTKVSFADKPYTCMPPGVAHKVISFGGGTFGWVDLCRGISVCNVFDEMPMVQFIQLPMLLPGNRDDFAVCPWPIRDVASCSGNGLIKLVEVEAYKRRVDEIPNRDRDFIYDSEFFTEPKYAVGWRTVTWSRVSSSNYWYKECVISDEEISIDCPRYPLLLAEFRESTLKNVLPSYPVLSLNPHSGDTVYLLCKLRADTQKMWLVTVDQKMKKLVELAPFSIRGYFSPAYPSQLSKYLNRAIDVRQHLSLQVDMVHDVRKKRRK